MKKIISTLLVVALLLTVLTVGIATTSAAETASITIYGLDGSTETKEVNVGDTFTVYTTLDVTDSVSNGKVGSIEGKQTYTSSILSLQDQISGQYGEFVDVESVFPITGSTTMANGATAGTIYYNASMPSVGFKFDTAYSKLIVTTYKVNAAGSAEVKNALTNLAAADENLTKIVYKGQLQDGMSIDGTATFDDPVPEIDHAHVTIYKLDGTTEEKDFNIGDTVDVYTMLNVSASVADGKVGSITGAQKYTTSVLELADTVSNGEIVDLNTVFPTTKTNTVTNCKTAGTIKYSASSASGFLFSDDNCQLIKTKYTVTANGFADIRNSMIVLAAADEDATRIVFGGETQPGKSYNMPASFYPPGEAPTEAPTEPPVPGKLKVTIIGLDGTQTEQSYDIGEEFTVYTMLDITGTLANGQVADVDGTQTYPAAKLQETDAVTGEYGEVVNKTAMFPILGDNAFATCKNGAIKFNASKPGINNGFQFNSPQSKLIVTNYKVLAEGTATIQTSLKTLVGADADVTKIVYKGVDQPGTSYTIYESFTDPGVEPTEPPTEEPPTEEPPTEEPPTEEPPTEEPPTDKAKITIYDINGNSTEKTFGVGETFTVYTSFDITETIPDGMISSISASQTFSNDILETADSIDSIGVVQNATEMFPVFGTQATARIDAEAGINKYNASTPYIGNGFVFNSDDCLLIVTKYTVTAAGTGEIRNAITTCAAADASLTRLVSKGVIQPGVVLNNRTDFYPPDYVPTEPPTEEPTEPPTEAPTEPPTEAPTEAPTEEPTEPPVTQAVITIYDIDGHGTTKTFDVGDTFTVYTTFDASQSAPNGISSINATQTFSTDVLESADTVDRSGLITDLNTVFPILGENAIARVLDNGTIKYNASKPTVNDGFPFNDASDLLIVTKYTVIAGGTGEVRNAITTCVNADMNLTRLVDKGVVAPGVVLGGVATFTKPAPIGETFLLGDADDNDEVEAIDATLIQRYSAYMEVPCDEAIMKRNGDVDDNGDLEIVDATFIQRWMAFMDVEYPIGEYVSR